MGNTNSSSLPPEINENIASYLDTRQLHRAATTNKYLHSHMSNRIRERSAMNDMDGYLCDPHPYLYDRPWDQIKSQINDRGKILRNAIKHLPPEKAATYWKSFVKTVENLRNPLRPEVPFSDDDPDNDPYGYWSITRTAYAIAKMNYSPEDFEKLVGGPEQMQTPLVQELLEKTIDAVIPHPHSGSRRKFQNGLMKYLVDTSLKQKILADRRNIRRYFDQNDSDPEEP